MKAFLLVTLFSVVASAADLNNIFPSDTKTSPAAADAVTRWLTEHCRDLNWALNVQEISNRYEQCTEGLEKVHIDVELSHLRGEFIFWVNSNADLSTVEWVYEEWPAWRICSYNESLAREDKSCPAK